MLRTIMELNDVTPEFLEIILSFYERKVALEEAFNSSVLRRQKGDILGISLIIPRACQPRRPLNANTLL
jgi:hypothetical protein